MHCGLFVRSELSPHLLILFDLVTQQYQRLGSELHSISFYAHWPYVIKKIIIIKNWEEWRDLMIFPLFFFMTKVLIMFSFFPGEFVCLHVALEIVFLSLCAACVAESASPWCGQPGTDV